jgi:Zn-dependent metalloprotease
MRPFYPLSFFVVYLLFCQTMQMRAQVRNEESLRADFSDGKPALIRFNPKTQVRGKQAQQVLKDNLEMGAHDEWVPLTISTDQSGSAHQKYQQHYKGIKVEYGVYSVHANKSVVESISGEFYPITDLAITPTLSEKQALERALRFTGATQYKWQIDSEEKGLKQANKDPQATYFPKAELLIFPKFLHPVKRARPEMALAYKFDVYAQQPLGRNLVYVDAHTGAIIYKEPMIKHADGKAATRYSGTRTIQTQLQSGVFQLKDNTRKAAIETFNMKTGKDYSVATNFTDADNNWTSAEFGNVAKDNAALDAHWGAMMTYDYFFTKHGRSSFDNKGGAIRNYVHFDKNYVNAFWDGSRMSYGDGNADFDPLTTIDIVGHEIGHGVCEHTANLRYLNESGALNEGLSDIWGAMVEHFAAPEKQTWLIGEEIPKNGGAFRSMSDPNAGGQPDTYLGTLWQVEEDDNGGVHTNSGVLNYWYYLLSIGKAGINDNGDNYTVTGIGMDKAASIVYRTESVYLTATSQYINAREFSIQAATDLFGANSNEVKQTINAWNAVGVYETVAPPSNLVGTAASTTSAKLTWKDNTTDETGFRIERATVGTSFVKVATVGVNITTYTNTGLPTNTVYYYRVKAIKGVAMSPASNEVVVILGKASEPRTVAEADSLALVDLYNSTKGANWKTKTNWLTGKANTWFGVKVISGRATSLSLPGNQLKGSLLASMGNLANLEFLLLGNNQLSGILPASMGNLANLKRLELQSNQFASLPTFLASFVNPNSGGNQGLFVRDNRLTFESLEANIKKLAKDTAYSPQDSIGTAANLALNSGQTLNLSALVGGANNRYQWTLDSKNLVGATNASLTITNVGVAQQGWYSCKVTNTVVTGLMLNRRRVYVKIICSPTNAAVKAGANRAVCEQDTVVFQAITPSFGQGTWKKISGAGVVEKVHDPLSKVVGLGYGENIFEWKASANTCGTDSVQASVSIIRNRRPDKPVVSLIGKDSLRSSTAGDSYQWFLEGSKLPDNTRNIQISKQGQYTVQVSSANCVSVLSDVFQFIITSLEPSTGEEWGIYPNPHAGHFTMQWPVGFGLVNEIAIVDALGKEVHRQKRTQSHSFSEEIDFSAHPSGTYFVKIQTGKGAFVKRMVVIN